MILKLGPCQPKAKDLPNSQFPKVGNRPIWLAFMKLGITESYQMEQ